MPEVVTSLAGWRALAASLRRGRATVGLTMTMGALHDGHASLLRRSARECDASLATVFVNPRQFDDPADLAGYEVHLDEDLEVCARLGVRAVLAPPVAEVWPDWPAPTPTTVSVAGLSEPFEGADRPGHFDGVASVVTKVLSVTGTCRAYFGEKDYQQLCVVRRLVGDLGLPATVVGCPIARAPDGLALSSRNARLDAASRSRAVVLHRALQAGRDAVATGDVIGAADAMRRVVATEPEMHLAYAAVVEPSTLRTLDAAAPGTEVRLLVAGVLEGVRLIDNLAAVAGAAR